MWQLKGGLIRYGVIAALIAASFSGTAFAQYTPDKAGLADAVHDYTINSWWESMIVDQLMTFKLSPGCWTAMNEKDGWGIGTTTRMARYMGDYARNTGIGDLEKTESANNNDRVANKPRAAAIVDQMKDKVSFTLQADGIKCDHTEWDLLHRYMVTVGGVIGDATWKPKGGASFITMIMSATAKDISVAVNPDGKHFTIVCPAESEPAAWDEKILKGMRRGSN